MSKQILGGFLRCIRLFILCLSLSCVICGAATGDPRPVSKDELVTLLQFYTSIQRLETSFKQTKTFKDIPTPLRSEGHLKVQRPGGVRWEITKPSHLVVSLSAQEIKIESGDGVDKTVQTFRQGDLPSGNEGRSLRSLVGWLEMDPSLLAHEYRVLQIGPSQFLFEPRDLAASPFVKLQMKLSNKKHVQELILFEKSGDKIDIAFSAPKVTVKK